MRALEVRTFRRAVGSGEIILRACSISKADILRLPLRALRMRASREALSIARNFSNTAALSTMPSSIRLRCWGAAAGGGRGGGGGARGGGRAGAGGRRAG